jgi:oligoribonuclease NrnB/cAMP/cGMP phosphodiesterase (DHH superfamily)
MTKIACVYHSVDLDGWMSAAIVKHWWKTLYFDYNNVHQTEEKGSLLLRGNFSNEEQERLDFIGYNYGQPIPDLTGYDKVIMCDISFSDNGKVAKEMIDLFGMNTLTDKRFIWIDHHKSAIELYHRPGVNYYIHGNINTYFAACELTWQHFFPDQPMPEIVRLLGRYDCFGHKGTDEELTVLEFQYGVRSIITNYNEAYDYLKVSYNTLTGKDTGNAIPHIKNIGKGIYSYLCANAKQTYKNGFTLFFNQTLYDNDGKPNAKVKQKFIAINAERFNPINFGIDYHKDGYDGCACFWIVENGIKFSLYNDNGEVDCSQICKNLGGGGHKGAAGFFIAEHVQKSFQEAIDYLLIKQANINK